jgi:hypothetical protein
VLALKRRIKLRIRGIQKSKANNFAMQPLSAHVLRRLADKQLVPRQSSPSASNGGNLTQNAIVEPQCIRPIVMARRRPSQKLPPVIVRRNWPIGRVENPHAALNYPCERFVV